MKRIASLFVLILMAGCSSPKMPPSPVPEIPTGSLQAREGIGRLFFEAMDPGTVYVYDASTTKVLVVQEVQKNERFILEPARDRATVEGKVVATVPMSANHIHRIYFLPGGATTAPSTRP